MRYTESAPRSAEILRLVLPQIARHGGSYVPTAYAVWYEHVAGTNSRLTNEIARREQEGEALDAPAIDDLFAEHILARDVENSRLLQKGLEDLARRLTSAATASSGSTEQFARELENGHAELLALDGAGELQDILQKLMNSTRVAHESVSVLRAELDCSQAELKSLREHLGTLQSEATHDPLTGLLNRRGFEQAASKLRIESRDGLASASLLMFDLDHFKRVNDNYGHLFGDQVLCATAKVLNSIIKGRDIAARFGGEEFIVLLPETPLQGAAAVAEQFRVAFSRARVRRSGSDKVVDQLSVSIGVAALRPDDTVEQALDRADQALYRAKNEGRNRVRVADAA